MPMKQILSTLFGPKNLPIDLKPRPLTIVSGLPRSGTSMMMKMLEAGGIPILTDNLRTSDSDNPNGYYEFERVKRLDDGDTAWLGDAQGKAVKIISTLLKYLPVNYSYKIIFMRRNLSEVLASQKKMLVNRNEIPEGIDDAQLIRFYEKHLIDIDHWMQQQSNISVLYIQYNDLLGNSLGVPQKINQFLGGSLNLKKMEIVVDPLLYRNKN